MAAKTTSQVDTGEKIRATVVGKVVSVFKGGARLSIQRSNRDNSERWRDYLTVWELFGVNVGDTIETTGDLSASLRFYEGRPQVQVNINSPSPVKIVSKAPVGTVANDPFAGLPAGDPNQAPF